MPKETRGVGAQVRQIILKQALNYLPDAMKTLGSIAKSAESEFARVQAARVIVNSAQLASDGMTEEGAGDELLKIIQTQSHIAPEDVPEAFNKAFPEEEVAPSITQMRAEAGHGWPNWQQKQTIWSRVSSATALIKATEGGYVPGKTASRAHRSDAQAVAISGGAGAGKSLWSGMEGLTYLPFGSLIWIIAYGYKKARPEFLYLSEGAMSTGLARGDDVHLPMDEDKPCSMYSIPHESQHGPIRCQVQTITVRDYAEQLATRRPDAIIVCEPGLIDELGAMEPTMWGRLAERRGRLIAAGTSEEMSEDWFRILNEWGTEGNIMGGEVYTLPSWENSRVYPKGEAEEVLQRFRIRFGDQLYQMRFGGRPAPPQGLVLKGFWTEDLIDEALGFDGGLPLEVFIDPNYAEPAKYSVGFVQWNELTGDINVIDGIAEEGYTHPQMIELFEAHPLARYVTGGELDPHAGGHHPGGSEDPMDYWRKVIPDLRCPPKQIPVVRTIGAIKQAMTPRGSSRPRLRVALCDGTQRFRDEATRWKLGPSGKARETWCDMLKGFGYWMVNLLAEERQREELPVDNAVRASDYNFSGFGRGAPRTADEESYWAEYERIYGGN